MNFIIHLLGLIILMIITASTMLALSTLGMVIEQLYHIEVFHWIVVCPFLVLFSLMLCIATKVYLQRFKNTNTYTVGYYDVAENEIEINEYKDLSTAEHAADTKRKNDGIASVVIIKHTKNRYTKLNCSKLIIIYENVNTIKEFKKTIIDKHSRRN
ncbi:hypothetical protein [Breznakia pachnodae]|uniref:Energy-coupling factor transporter transmembrane protein EcfT n=1 Tax=Breznakia pachnodae TaxID=265178 RepID=A0ABU0E6N5_9FIRM|nr:hypothetical protein [Breznakia pachnodae]MDQ0362567.1 energy-coupling factor transporter transmembrane protein EcfT [Breznakia pachnodae]